MSFSDMQDASGALVLAPLTPDRYELGEGVGEVPVIAFYCAGTGLTKFDRRSGGAPFGNFWPLPSMIAIEHDGIRSKFSNSEAAYQAFKWWHHEDTRRAFERCDAPSLQGGEQAVMLKRRCENDAALSEQKVSNMAGLGKFDAMLLVLRAKWRLPGLRELLCGSAGCLLVEHAAEKGRDPYWTDDFSGGGQNRLGAALMLVRDELLAEAGEPSAWPSKVPRPSWAGGTDGADADVRWQRMIDELAPQLVRADAKPRAGTWLQRFSQLAFWAIMAGIFAAAYIQGEAFGADKESATIIGATIGVASFFAWLAVDEEDDDEAEDEQAAAGEDEVTMGVSEKDKQE